MTFLALEYIRKQVNKQCILQNIGILFIFLVCIKTIHKNKNVYPTKIVIENRKGRKEQAEDLTTRIVEKYQYP